MAPSGYIGAWHLIIPGLEGRIAASYTRDGIPRSDSEALSIYGMILPFFAVTGIQYAKELYEKTLAPSYKEGF